jgi:hypothetical protein
MPVAGESSRGGVMQVVLDVPESYMVGTSPEELGRQLKLYAALLMYRAGQLSAGAACELGSVDRYTFLEECKRFGIETLHGAAEELESDLILLDGSTRAGRR